MAAQQLSESFRESLEVSVTEEVWENDGGAEQLRSHPNEESGNGPIDGVQAQSAQELYRNKKGSSSESDWKTTTDTSIQSSPSDHEVPPEVLEACNGIDDMILSSSPDSPIQLARDRAPPRRGRGSNIRTMSSRCPIRTRSLPSAKGRLKLLLNQESETSSSTSSSNSSSSSDSNSDCSYSPCTSVSSNYPESYESEDRSCTECNSDCSCSCHDYSSTSASSTSYESADDLTNLPRAKRGGHFGAKGAKKVVEQSCPQS